MRSSSVLGFTLIQVAIVLVLIGLIVGGVFVGLDLINGAGAVAQISQIQKYESAVDTFESKFLSLPGDMTVTNATRFGFTVGPGCAGQYGSRDGNQLIEGYTAPWVLTQGMGEPELFWQDLSSAASGNLIPDILPGSAAPAVVCGNATNADTVVDMSQYLPVGKMGFGTFVYVYASGGYNWYGLANVQGVGHNIVNTQARIPVIQAYNLDKKIDDGLPTQGTVQAIYVKSQTSTSPAPNAATDDTSTCYNTTSSTYSLSAPANRGSGRNCALSFKFP